MQQCTMNGDTFTRKDDGTLFLNGDKIIMNQIQPNPKLTFQVILSFGLGIILGILLQ